MISDPRPAAWQSEDARTLQRQENAGRRDSQEPRGLKRAGRGRGTGRGEEMKEEEGREKREKERKEEMEGEEKRSSRQGREGGGILTGRISSCEGGTRDRHAKRACWPFPGPQQPSSASVPAEGPSVERTSDSQEARGAIQDRNQMPPGGEAIFWPTVCVADVAEF